MRIGGGGAHPRDAKAPRYFPAKPLRGSSQVPVRSCCLGTQLRSPASFAHKQRGRISALLPEAPLAPAAHLAHPWYRGASPINPVSLKIRSADSDNKGWRASSAPRLVCAGSVRSRLSPNTLSLPAIMPFM